MLNADETAAVLRNLDNVPLNQLDDSVQLARGDNIGPGVFRFDSMADFNAAANRAHPNVRYEVCRAPTRPALGAQALAGRVDRQQLQASTQTEIPSSPQTSWSLPGSTATCWNGPSSNA